MSERDVAAMLDRLADRTPPMDVPIPEVVRSGRARRRHRRVAGAGMTLAGVLLAGGLWWGVTDTGPLGSSPGVAPAATGPSENVEVHGDPVVEGGRVTLLGEAYEVAVDEHGWPMLRREDGSVFLRVSDGDGPPRGDGGGVVMWRERWWPWSDRYEVHFSYSTGDRPDPGPGVRGQEAVTITGPSGEVRLVAVRAGS